MLPSFKDLIKKSLSNIDFLDLLIRNVYVSFCELHFNHKFKELNVKQNSILFECFKGKMVNDSPLSIYNYLISHNFKGKFIWVLSSKEHPLYQYLINKKHTSVVIYGTNEYFKAYATCQYWIVNCRIPLKITKKKSQKFIQCWHGTPLKKMGFDIQFGDNAKVSQSGLKYAYSIEASKIDYFLSPSEYASKCFISSFGLKKSQILEQGYPRNDEVFNGNKDFDLINALKVSLKIPVDKTIILYAPTWRDNRYSDKEKSHILHNPLANNDFLDQFNDDFVFLYRGHYFTSLEGKSSKFIDVSSYDNVNDLYLIADLLITDYSSVFFDFSILNKPTLFFMYDREEYENKLRGFYLDIDIELPGDICSTPSVLASKVFSSLKKKHNLSAFNNRFNPYEDGHSTERVVESFLSKNV